MCGIEHTDLNSVHNRPLRVRLIELNIYQWNITKMSHFLKNLDIIG